ncbi:hypothetical protein EES43_16595 [Streptomyces sp. ADI96-02]|uniref:hypothetical protein n=1 Tax=Streptomyces sp. ADI96-02 TaxID=1522760 RepID=UPI000F551972|nr:hypothetical protein [Streptomyces sp. ADI96-02]RPK60870.1 hypothetical protein EES43_16595 [Streptomyces sp. ADI96-02]
MTQSGQGGERQLPAGRPAHEGVVLPSDGGAPWNPGESTGGPAGQDDRGGQAAPAAGQPWGGSWEPRPEAPPQQPGVQAPGAYGYPQPLPPVQQGPGQGYGQGAGGYEQPPHPGPYQQPQPYAQPLPPEAGGPGPHRAPGGDADATQFIAPVPGGPGPGGLPPEQPPAASGGYPGTPGPGGDADATQYIPPVPGGAPYDIRPGAPGDRQPPAEFDNLFRAEGPAGATQQMPRFDAAQQPPPPYGQQPPPPYGQQQPHQAPPPQQPYPGGQLPPHTPPGYGPGPQGPHGGGPHEPPRQHGGDAPRRRSARVLIAAVVGGCAVIGLGAGALMSGGDEPADDKRPVASQSTTAQEEPTTKAAVDPAKPQAEALDKLLADSNDSRAAVISAVEKIKSCKDLDRAGADLRGAAQQRRDLVTRLGGLSLDELPRNADLTTSLTKAWKASAAADEHYAAWARQAQKNKGVCKGGRARSTNETARANQQSGEATAAKQQASGLWNAIASKYGLTQHGPTEL